MGTWVQNAIRESEVLNIANSDDLGIEAEPRTHCTHVPTQTTDTARAIVADPVDNFDPMDLI